MSDTEKPVRAKIVRTFNDAGSERSFTAGETERFSEGEFANFHAAGLVEKAEDPAPAEQSAASSGRPRG